MPAPAVPTPIVPDSPAALVEGVALLLDAGQDAEALAYLERHFAPALCGMSNEDWRRVEETIARYEEIEAALAARPALVADRTGAP